MLSVVFFHKKIKSRYLRNSKFNYDPKQIVFLLKILDLSRRLNHHFIFLSFEHVPVSIYTKFNLTTIENYLRNLKKS